MKGINKITDPETVKLIESLQLHQIEMERQNEELKLAKVQADNATQKYAELYDFSPSGYFTLSRDGVIAELNLCGSQMIGVDRKTAANRDFRSFVSNDTRIVFTLFLENVFQSDRKETCEVTLIVENSPPMFVQVSSIVTRNGEFCLMTVTDITERKRAEIALVESEEKFRNFIQYSSDPIFSFNKDDTYLYVNEAFARPFGKIPEEIIGKTQYDILPVAEAEKRLIVVHQVFQTGIKMETEVKIVTPAGEVQYFLTSADPLMNPNGEVLYVNCVSKEITQLKKVEQALKDSEAQLAAILAAIPDMIFILDRQGVYLDYCGPITEELYTSPIDFIGKNIHDVLPPALAQQFELAFEAAIATGEVQFCEYFIDLSNGRNYFEGKVVAYAESKLLTITRNISGYKQAEELISRKNEDLYRLNVEKDKFFSIIAHDLRGPFSGFLGLTEALAKRLPDMTLKEIQEITFLMRNSAIHLFRLLGNLLEWSQMQRGLSAFEPKQFLVKQKIEDYLVLADQMAAEKEITIKMDLPDDMMIFADVNMFDSIIRNLISNAIKYTSKNGKIIFKFQKLPDNSVEISVRDTGIGMDEKLIDQLFRIDLKSGRKGTAGELSSGLGLIICKDFIEKHCGKLEVTSKEGVGSTFCFTLPPQ